MRTEVPRLVNVYDRDKTFPGSTTDSDKDQWRVRLDLNVRFWSERAVPLDQAEVAEIVHAAHIEASGRHIQAADSALKLAESRPRESYFQARF